MLNKGKCPICKEERMVGNSFYSDTPICWECEDDFKDAEENGESLSIQRMIGRKLNKPQSKREGRIAAQGRRNFRAEYERV